MFERRLKIFLAVLAAGMLLLLGRAAQLQIFQRNQWEDRAAEIMRRSQHLETTRGRILDFRGREMAADVACNDAAVDYRAIVKDPAWIKSVAQQRVRDDPELAADTGRRAQHVREQTGAVEHDIDAMWADLARVSGKTPEEIEQIKQGIIDRVEQRRRSVWYRRMEAAARRDQGSGPLPWYRKWLVGDDSDDTEAEEAAVTVGEQKTTHVILRAIDAATYSALDRHLGRYPGLELKKSAHRVYAEPAATCAAHVLGHMSMVTREDLENDPNVGVDELRRYYPNDLIGRGGLESLAEPLLRGSTGNEEYYLGSDSAAVTVKPVAGKDVRCTIDVALQNQIMQAFRSVTLHETGEPDEERTDLHGGAVVIDVPTGQVRALVSYPTYDANRFDADYAALAADQIDRPLLNRATMAQYEPGSSVKTVIGSWAVTWGVVGVHEGIECTGYLILHGQKMGRGRCWVASLYEHKIPSVAHHPVPLSAPHRGEFGNPDGFLTVTDALERSCNVYFETVADRMGLDRVALAMHEFGLGEPTGLGIPEARGRIPRHAPPMFLEMTTCFAGIGQGQVAATPIQMANVAATIARDGVWMRPRLLADDPLPARRAPEASTDVGPTTLPDRTEDRVVLAISPEALAAVKLGMIRVVNSPAGTGKQAARTDMIVAGKTGSAQASLFTVPLLDAHGQPMRGPDGRVMHQAFEPGSFPWYQGVGPEHHLDHAWFIGFAPAENPQIAFAVLVEYGGAGGHVAGGVARELLEACVKEGYLRGHSQE